MNKWRTKNNRENKQKRGENTLRIKQQEREQKRE